MPNDDILHHLALELIPEIGGNLSRQLIAYTGSAKAVFDTPNQKLEKIPGIGKKISRNITQYHSKLKEAEKIIEECNKKNIALIPFNSNLYPSRLKNINNSPGILYTKGSSISSLNKKKLVVSIVGTRSATNYGKEVTDSIVKDLNTLDVVIVSGLAYGIDIAAHRASLKHNIPTFAILAGGLDSIYPPLHQKEASQILKDGGIISENKPGVKPETYFFPARNRIISGLSDVVIVVEAAKKGGALITAKIAHSYNRIVFSVPGNIGNPFSEGTNELIASQKALIYTKIDDLLFQLSWDVSKNDKTSTKEKNVEHLNLNSKEKIIYELLKKNKEGLELDQIARRLTISISEITVCITTMEFNGLIKILPGKTIKIV